MAVSKFRMSDAEILDYMDAATDLNKALDALAVKCRTSRQIMREHLGNLGIVIDDEPAPEKKPLDGFKVVIPTKKKGGRPAAPMDEIRAMELFNDGLDDLAMAETLGVGEHRVKEWRRRMHLQRLPGRRAAQREQKKLEVDAVMKKFKELETEDTVIEEAKQREQAFEEILESVDAGKQQKPVQPECGSCDVAEDTNVPDNDAGSVPTRVCPADCKGAPPVELLSVGGFIQILMELTNEKLRSAGLVLDGRRVNGIHRLILDSTGNTLTVEVETC